MEDNLAYIRDVLYRITDTYPEEIREAQKADVDRIAFHLSIVASESGTSRVVCDVGGGIGLFSVGAAALGMEAILVDDFRDNVNSVHGQAALETHRQHGVRIISADAAVDDLDLAEGSLDVVTSFDSIEHWHSSPKSAFHRLLRALRPDGLFFLGVPNCVNLRKRVTIPLGIGKWSTMEDWYERQTFRGHVREPDVEDLRYIARDLRLHNVRIFGRNWLGLGGSHSWVRRLTPLADSTLRLFPSLCSDIYLLGRNPSSNATVDKRH